MLLHLEIFFYNVGIKNEHFNENRKKKTRGISKPD